MTITGNGVTKTIIQASTCNPVTLPGGCTPATYRVFEVKNTGNLTLDSLTVRYGNCTGACAIFVNLGGGIYNEGTVNLKNSILSDNNSSFTGGGIRSSGTLTVTDSTLSGNKAVTGGGIYNIGTMTVANSTFSGNTSTWGGGIYHQGPSATVTNSTFFNNSASSIAGGGINNETNMTVRNSTFSGNSAPGINGGGIYNHGSLIFANTIIANSTSGGDCRNGATIVSNINNLVEDGTCNAGTTLQNFKTGDPNLGSLADNGGPTQTMALQSPSTAIDGGDAATCAAAPISNKDQRGVTRPIDGDAVAGAICDIGAFEYGAIIPVVTASNPSANAVLTSLSTINITFNQDMKNDGSAKAANNTANYLLVERGANGTFDTLSCNGGLVSDDVAQTISTATYSNLVFMSTLTLASPLATGTYRLFICGTTSIWSVAGLELNNGLSDATVDFTINSTTTTTTTGSSTSTTASSLPTTGFPPNKITSLPVQSANSVYAALGDLWLEIPALNVKSNIVGVPQSTDKTWNVSWLGNDTGWLNGTAFPTWNGNSVLTAHVTNADGLDGPFAALKNLKYGDQIIVHMGGAKYIFEVRTFRMVRPYSTSFAFESLQDHSYLTLITCQSYNPLNESYLFRRIVRAVLVEVK